MIATDISATEAEVEFTPVRLDHPLMISGRAIDWFTTAEVTLHARSRSGDEAVGHGSSVLSVPWSWPVSEVDVETRDGVLRGLVQSFADLIVGQDPADPIQIWRTLYSSLDALSEKASIALGEPIPRLAALLALGAVDSAVHDAWAKAAGRSAYEIYDAEHLADDLSFLGLPELSGRYPGEFLSPARASIPVQHLIGVTDPITTTGDDGTPSMVDWIARESPRYFKVKTSGADPVADAERVAAVSDALSHAVGEDFHIVIDPNEGLTSVRMLDSFIDELILRDLRIDLIEQPTPRSESLPDVSSASARVPVVLDEGFSHLDALSTARAQGWSGIVIKAGKGQTLALLAHAYARVTGMTVTVQDLTTVGTAFFHSARLVSVLNLTSPHLEYNSRQYAPHGNDALRVTHPDMTDVRDGTISLPVPLPGIY